jgi:3'-phosphoadenosine 5'-phosphosulfate sulfotransferase (PAPS reductase)/FAD synthetase
LHCLCRANTLVPVTCTPDLNSYDIILVNSSAGKDSQAMLDYLVELADAQAVSRDRIVVVHCDLGRVEWQGTVELAAEQAEHYGLRFEIVRRDLGDLLTQVEQRHQANVGKGKSQAPWPSSTARWCTSDQKTSQVLKLITKLTADFRPFPNSPSTILARPVRILNCLGIRAQESAARAKKASFEVDKKASNSKRHVDRWLPIFTWSEEQVWDRIHASGVRYHEAYEAGMERLSCCFCVLASRKDLIIAAKHNQALAQEYVAVEERVGWRFTNDFSIKDIVAAAAA